MIVDTPTSEEEMRGRMRLSSESIWKIVMKRGLGYTQKEIADQLGITQRAVSYRLKQIRKMCDGRTDNRIYIELLRKSDSGVRNLLSGIVSRVPRDRETPLSQ